MKCGSWCTNPQTHQGIKRGRKKGSWSRWKEHENQNRVETTAGTSRDSTLSAGAIGMGGNSRQNCKQQHNTTSSWKWHAACIKQQTVEAEQWEHLWTQLQPCTGGFSYRCAHHRCVWLRALTRSQQWADLWRHHMTVMVQKQRLEGGGRDPLYLPYPYTDVISFKAYDPWSLNAEEEKTK